jgi:tetratricopeptide (TPR) repeat protein
MRRFITKVGLMALLSTCLASAGLAQSSQSSSGGSNSGSQGSSASGQTAPGATTPGSGGPKVSKEEEKDYKGFYDNRTGDPAHLISLGEAFIAKYPMSAYLFAVYSTLTGAYLQVNQPVKMLDAGSKALFLNPDDVDVLPLMGWAIARQVTGKTPDAAGQLQKAGGYAHHALDLINTMPKPAGLDDAAFASAKNQKLAMCHSALGTVDIKTSKYDDAITELTMAVMLSSTPDPVDYYLLGLADVQTSHFSDAQAAFNKCAVNGSVLQGACKSGADDAKNKAKNSLEAPK